MKREMTPEEARAAIAEAEAVLARADQEARKATVAGALKEARALAERFGERAVVCHDSTEGLEELVRFCLRRPHETGGTHWFELRVAQDVPEWRRKAAEWWWYEPHSATHGALLELVTLVVLNWGAAVARDRKQAADYRDRAAQLDAKADALEAWVTELRARLPTPEEGAA